MAEGINQCSGWKLIEDRKTIKPIKETVWKMVFQKNKIDKPVARLRKKIEDSNK